MPGVARGIKKRIWKKFGFWNKKFRIVLAYVTCRVPMSFLTKIQPIWFCYLASHISKHINERKTLLYRLQLYSYFFFTTETFTSHNYFLDLCFFFHLIKFKFMFSFSFLKIWKTGVVKQSNHSCFILLVFNKTFKSTLRCAFFWLLEIPREITTKW